MKLLSKLQTLFSVTPVVEEPTIAPVTSLVDYQREAMRVRSDGTTPFEDFKNASMGLVTEVAELVDLYKRKMVYKVEIVRKYLVEEMGDVLWYLALAHNALGMTMLENPAKTMVEVTPPSQDMTMAKLVRYSSNIYAVVHAYPETALDSGLDYDLQQLLMVLQFFAEQHGIRLFEAAHSNLVKMVKRYPNGFNTHDAVNRDKDYELSHIL